MPDLINGLGGTAGFGENAVSVTDDGSSSLIDLSSLFPSGFTFFGNTFSAAYINNNGNLTFDTTLSAFTPFGISNADIPIIAAFFADVDTRGGAATASSGGTSTGSNRVWYDLDTGTQTFTVTWDDVGYFNRKINKQNAFQIQLIHVGDASSTDFDLKFIYETINWTTGDFSGGSNGLGGTVARVGLSGGNGTYYELAGSGNGTSMLGLATNGGEYTFHFRSSSATSGGDTVVGTTGNDMLYSGDGGDTIDGGGGFDVMFGGADNDTYIVDSTDDQVIEAANEGIDTVQSSVTYTIGNNVENLTLTGNGTIDGTGNALDNVLTGNAVNNTLTGLAGKDTLDGGGGNDVLIGGDGDDTYYVSDYYDTVTEDLNQGTDLVYAASEYILTNNVENLTLTGTGSFDGGGNALNNVITGNSGDNVLYGQDGNDVLDGGGGHNMLLGADGDDTYIVRTSDDTISPWGDAGTDTVKAYMTWTLGGELENLTLMGTGGISAFGNELANVLTGNSGNNTLNGMAGDDTMRGGAGDDTYWVNSAGDVISEETVNGVDDGGTDTVVSEVDWTLSARFEVLLLNGSGNPSGTGNALDNRIRGNEGDNVIDGGTGADFMIGRTGDDTFYVDNAGDWVSELADQGIDKVMSSISYTLSGNVENLTLTGAADNNATGNALENELRGNTGANVLNGRQGADTMYGGAGNDTYYIDNDGDLASETLGEDDTGGNDTVISDHSYTLGDFIENLRLTGTGDITATGNDLNNELRGNSGSNDLDGGTGADTMYGGAGNDFYTVDNAGDAVYEGADGGVNDTVMASLSWKLGANVENLVLTGNDNINATGNGLGNTLTGNGGNNMLNGGTGADVMYGLAGNDTYYVDDANDVVSEQQTPGNDDGGTDTVMSSIDYTLGDYVENLTLNGAGVTSGFGNSLNNVIRGSANDNTLWGLGGVDSLYGGDGADTLIGGTGADKLTGGAGADTFQFSAIADNGRDRILDFTSGEDHLAFRVDDFGLSGMASNDIVAFLDNALQNLTSTAVGSGPQFLFNATTHVLSWDSNGTAAGGVTAIALLDNVTSLTASDFAWI